MLGGIEVRHLWHNIRKIDKQGGVRKLEIQEVLLLPSEEFLGRGLSPHMFSLTFHLPSSYPPALIKTVCWSLVIIRRFGFRRTSAGIQHEVCMFMTQRVGKKHVSLSTIAGNRFRGLSRNPANKNWYIDYTSLSSQYQEY